MTIDSHEELRALCAEDLADARIFRDDEAFIASQARRGRVEALVAAGVRRTADDYYHASRIFQHGERLEHWWTAHELARVAAVIGNKQARYQAAAALDRWLLWQGRPQKYGTNSVQVGDRWRVGDYDAATTDAERAEWDVPPLAELLARGERAFGGLSVAEAWAQPLVTVVVQGLGVAIFDLDTPDPLADLPISGVPPYRPLRDGLDPRPTWLPPAVSLWRFGQLSCAKDHAGYPVCSWHRCRWELIASDDRPVQATAEALFVALARHPQWLTLPGALWSRLGLATSPTACWLVGGQLARDDLARLALSLP